MKMVFINLNLFLACFFGSLFLICSGSIFRGRGSIGATAGNVLVLYSVDFPQKLYAAMKVPQIQNCIVRKISSPLTSQLIRTRYFHVGGSKVHYFDPTLLPRPYKAQCSKILVQSLKNQSVPSTAVQLALHTDVYPQIQQHCSLHSQPKQTSHLLHFRAFLNQISLNMI